MIFVAIICGCLVGLINAEDPNEIANDIRPYEFAFNVIDFQHRFEKQGKVFF